MKLIRFGKAGEERPGMIDAAGRLRDVSSHIEDWRGDALGRGALRRFAAVDTDGLPEIPRGTRLGPPVAGVGKIICIGLNYSDHAAEAGAEPPAEPVIFFKSTTAICGPDDDVMLPKGSEKTDWEVELAVVIGKTARYVEKARALDHVAGYMVINDLSERAYQLERGGGWVKGKSCDTFAPLGPWLVTAEEVVDPQSLDLTLSVNGETLQDGCTADMVFGVAELISYLSGFMTLMPGDVISTGTPAGVGLGQKPPRYLKAGDVMQLSITGLGAQRQTVIPYRPAA